MPFPPPAAWVSESVLVAFEGLEEEVRCSHTMSQLLQRGLIFSPDHSSKSVVGTKWTEVSCRWCCHFDQLPPGHQPSPEGNQHKQKASQSPSRANFKLIGNTWPVTDCWTCPTPSKLLVAMRMQLSTGLKALVMSNNKHITRHLTDNA